MRIINKGRNYVIDEYLYENDNTYYYKFVDLVL